MTNNAGRKTTCVWCGRGFTAPAGRGPLPRYCSRSHRQRAYEARRQEASRRSPALRQPIPRSAVGRNGELGRLSVPKSSDVLVAELRRRILDGLLPPGSPLPPERALVEQTGLSRMTVREALRILELEGLVVIKPGRTGGAVVCQPEASNLSHHLDVFIRGRQMRLASLFEFREAVEPTCAALAAQRRTEEDLAALNRSVERMGEALEDLPAFLAENLNWHLLVARASHNELMSAVMETLARAIYAVMDMNHFNTPERRRIGLRAHQQVTQAIKAKDEDAARRRMTRHVGGFTTAVGEIPGLKDAIASLVE